MTKVRRVALAGMIVGGVALLGAIALRWDEVSAMLADQSERGRAALFRAGELMSISRQLRNEYGAMPELAYAAEATGRVLSIGFGEDYAPPLEVEESDHALEIAVFAVGQTAKRDQIDLVTVRLGDERFRFTLDELETASN